MYTYLVQDVDGDVFVVCAPTMQAALNRFVVSVPLLVLGENNTLYDAAGAVVRP